MFYFKLLLVVFFLLCCSYLVFRLVLLWKLYDDFFTYHIPYSKKSNSFVFVIFERDSKQILEVFLNEEICIDIFNRSYTPSLHSWIAINLSCIFEDDLLSIKEVPYAR